MLWCKGRKRCDVGYGGGYGRDVVFDQQLGANLGVRVEAGGADAAEVAKQPRAEDVGQRERIVGVFQGEQVLETVVDELVIVVVRDGILSPVRGAVVVSRAPIG